MANISPKRKALKILIKNKLYSLTDYNDLQRIIESNQFTIIEYRKNTNSEFVTELIKRLKIENEIKQNNSFLYIKNNLKFLFINKDISVEDKCSLLRHELGHIYDDDLMNSDVNYSKIKKEEFANQFSCYIKSPGIAFKLLVFITKKWKPLVCTMAILACVLGLSFKINTPPVTQPTKSAADNILLSEGSDNTYYVTSKGKKYHRKYCMIIKHKNNLIEMTLTAAINNGYEPCLICNPREE